jgi:hypothetical protein
VSGSRRVNRSVSEECSRSFFLFLPSREEDHEISQFVVRNQRVGASKSFMYDREKKVLKTHRSPRQENDHRWMLKITWDWTRTTWSRTTTRLQLYLPRTGDYSRITVVRLETQAKSCLIQTISLRLANE